jgi:hypothetical protein
MKVLRFVRTLDGSENGCWWQRTEQGRASRQASLKSRRHRQPHSLRASQSQRWTDRIKGTRPVPHWVTPLGPRALLHHPCSTSCGCATRRHVSGGGCETRRSGLSQQSGEAEGSLTPEVWGRAGSSPDNDGTGRHRQTARVRQARETGVTIEPAIDPPQVWNRLQPGGCGPGSSARELDVRASDSGAGCCSRRGGHGEGLRRSRGEAAGVELGADPVDRYMVNVGTVPVLPFPASGQLVGGQVHRRLMTPGRGGGSVVVRASESDVHGEGTQRVRSTVAGMPGGRW